MTKKKNPNRVRGGKLATRNAKKRLGRNVFRTSGAKGGRTTARKYFGKT